MDAATFDEKLSKTLNRHARRYPVQAAVRCERLGIDFSYGDADLPFHTASVGKLAPAAVTMQLIDEGTLTLRTPLLDYFESGELTGLFTPGSEHRVTVAQLLTHTSGVNDYFGWEDKHSPFIAAVLADPDRLWSPAELVDFTRQKQQPIAEPGAQFSYSDTGFVLLGLLLERVTGEQYHEILERRIFAPLAMDRSFMPLRSTPKLGSDKIAPVTLEKTRLDGTNAMSIDWAGGGIAATAADYLTLIRALHNGSLISQAAWEWMTEQRNRYYRGLYYGAGAMGVRFNEFAPWLRGWPVLQGHLGVTSAHLWYDPVHDAEIVLNYGDSAAMRTSFGGLSKLVGLLRSVNKSVGG